MRIPGGRRMIPNALQFWHPLRLLLKTQEHKDFMANYR